MASFENALRAVNAMKEAGVVAEYAVAGGMAQAFWVEAIPTYDLDVLVALPQEDGVIVSLAAIYQWANARGYPTRGEYVVIDDIPVQFLPSPDPLTDEALDRAATLRFGETEVRVVRPEYLIAMYLHGSARTRQRRERAATLRDGAEIDQSLLHDVMERFGLEF
ncbi:MAG TPA: hypothetical protein VGQ46_05175 [Thermoanaerobaculia bacterium]|jgi:hypothetical protein|nr:hypothetical protein [Thermoanaerobaculia bacterium]